MNCQKCIEECKGTGNWCVELTFEDIEASRELGIEDPHQFQKEHMSTAHRMTLWEGFWWCEKRHKVEADPADAMRAAGVPPLL